jgi:hypothetical protein
MKALAPFQPWRGTTPELLEAFAGVAPRWCLRGSQMRTRQGLMAEWAAAARFPPHFGGTWDALRDCLSDLPEGGTFLVLDADQVLQEASRAEGQTWVAVMGAVAEDLAPRPFRLVLQAGPERYEALLERLQLQG